MITRKPGHKHNEGTSTTYGARSGRAKGEPRTLRVFATGLSDIRCRWDLSWLRASTLTGSDTWRATDPDPEAYDGP